MNVVKILLVLGLGYVALTQKVEKTRNMLLVVTGLLAFCMFSVEGFTIASDTDFSTIFSGSTGTLDSASDNTIEVTGSDRYTFSGTGDITLDGSTSIPSTVTCKTGTTGDTEGTVGYKSSQTAWGTPSSVPSSVASIDDYLTCTTPCPSTAPSTNQCGTGYQYKATTGVNYTGAVGGVDYRAKCCGPTPTSPMPNCGANAECSLSILGDADDLADDDSNKCSEALYGAWTGTCSCSGSGTWTPDTGSGNGCSASSS